ncbi:MAG: TonB-dependent receptor [Erythrobacter sp.]|nr:TonB-dependent receptor [Erythrobacter sp.]
MLYHNHRSPRRVASSLAALAFALAAAPGVAQTQPTAAEPEPVRPAGEDDLHNRQVGADGVILVTAPGLEQLDVLAGTSLVEGRELQREMNGQIGEILAKQPGVSATSFSPGASRPVLRGFEGERVKILIDGIGAIDVSNTSADHAVSIEPLTAERIEILRGPAVLLYGSQAIGGAVNVIDKRIPTRRLNEPFHLDVLAEADTAYDLRSGAASLDVPLGDYFVAHIDGSYRNTDDLEVPGFTLSPALRADILADVAEETEEGNLEEAEELREAAEQRGILPNSYTETYSVNGGLTLFAGESNLGFAAGYYDSTYGVPGRPGTGHAHGEEGEEEEGGEEEGEEQVSIGLEQFRADMRGELMLGDGFFSMLRTRVGYSDYTHTEFEGDEVGTVFDVEGIEARAELVQNDRGRLGGALGVQYYYRDFEAIGAEAFVAPNRTDQFAIFALQEYDLDSFQIEGAARYEMANVESIPLGVERDFDLFSGALSLIYEPGGDDRLRIGITGSRAERAPGGEELFADGPHIATQAFEIGDVNLNKESAWGVEAFVRGEIGPATVSVSVFQNWFDDYIYLQGTGAEEDDLPVFQYLQADADYFGVEGEVQLPLVQSDRFSLAADLRGSYIEAELDDGTPLPRIPPFTALGALDAVYAGIGGRVEVQYFGEQDEIAPFETVTDDFTFVNASLSFSPLRDNDLVRLVLKADNIFDVTGRRHASFTKDFVPLAGRNFKVSLLASF